MLAILFHMQTRVIQSLLSFYIKGIVFFHCWLCYTKKMSVIFDTDLFQIHLLLLEAARLGVSYFYVVK